MSNYYDTLRPEQRINWLERCMTAATTAIAMTPPSRFERSFRYFYATNLDTTVKWLTGDD